MLLGRCSEMPRLALLIECWENLIWPTKGQLERQKTMINTFREHLQRAIFETFDLWGIWSECWENLTWPTKGQLERQRQRQWQIHLENTYKERPLRFLTFEICDQSDEKTWPWPTKLERQIQKQWWWQKHLENTTKEGFLKILENTIKWQSQRSSESDY